MKKFLLISAIGTLPSLMAAQSAVDAFQLSQPDFKGTARFMSMGGAFGALGGDLSTLNQNPGGIGVYRSSEVGVTMDIDIQSVKGQAQGVSSKETQTKVYCNNFGYVGTARLDNTFMPTFSWGISYSRAKSFDRVYSGSISNMGGASLSNYVARSMNDMGITDEDLGTIPDQYDPYYDPMPGTRDSYAPWLGVLSYDSFLISPDSNGRFEGLVSDVTVAGASPAYGSSSVFTREQGYVDEYSINFGGNFVNMVSWGIGFGIHDINFTSDSYYDESWGNATIPVPRTDNDGNEYYGTGTGDAYFDMYNHLHTWGTGFNMKLGIIVKPINEFRVGLAVHTPTWYSVTSEYYADMDYKYSSGVVPDPREPLPGTPYGSNSFNFKSPWRLIASAAGVIGGRGIISMDYEYRGYDNMSISDSYGPYEDTNNDIKSYYKGTNTLRIGAEYRVTPSFSLRAGYNWTSSPVEQQAKNNGEIIYTAGTRPSYTFDNTTQYITCGLGYRYKGFYADAAYVHKHRTSTWHAFSPVVNQSALIESSPELQLTDNNNSIVLSIGFKF